MTRSCGYSPSPASAPRSTWGVLGRMLRLAVRNGKLTRLPDFRDLKPKEAAPRSGFFEDHQYEAIRRHLPEDLRPAVTIAHTYGWRT